MNEKPMDRIRRRIGYVMLIGLVLGGVYFFSPGIPVMFAPWASASTIEAGKELFNRDWQAGDPLAKGDGLGPLFNATSCVACHFQGGVGGAGDNHHNVTSYEVHPTKKDPELRRGLIHVASVDPKIKETPDMLRELFPIVKGFTRTITNGNGCSYVETVPDFDPVHINSVNTTSLFGAGWVDKIPTKAITHKHMGRLIENVAQELQLKFTSVPAGRPRILGIGKIGKFGWKAQFATLEEFVAAACANELGLGNPLMEQAKPIGSKESPSERPDLDKKQFKNLVGFVKTLPKPKEILPAGARERDQAIRGKQLFTSVGCALCHTPNMGGVDVYSDFLLHRITDFNKSNSSYSKPSPEEAPLPQDQPRPDEWKTPPLWGVADSAPYFHDGGSATLKDAILRHGGDAQPVTEAYQKQLSVGDQEAIIAFLNTLKAPPEAEPVAVAKK